MNRPGVGDAPYRAGTIVGHEESAVLCDGDSDRPAPDVAFGRHESDQEVFVFAGGLAILERDADDLVPGAPSAVPTAVFGGETVQSVFAPAPPAGGLRLRPLERAIRRDGARTVTPTAQPKKTGWSDPKTAISAGAASGTLGCGGSTKTNPTGRARHRLGRIRAKKQIAGSIAVPVGDPAPGEVMRLVVQQMAALTQAL